MKQWIYENQILELRDEELKVKNIIAVVGATFADAAYTGFEPKTSAIRFQRSTTWVNKPTEW